MKLFRYTLIGLQALLCLIGVCFTVNTGLNGAAVGSLLLLFASFSILNVGSYVYHRKRFIDFSNEICRQTEAILQGESIKQEQNRETLTSKMIMELEKVEDIFQFQLSESQKEKKELQEMVSEVTHQIKTPVSNIQMFCDMFSDPHVSASEAKGLIEVIRQQLEKLEFLLNSLVKSSRLEAALINLHMRNSKVIETLALAINPVMQKAELKNISIAVDCRPGMQVYHDTQWTAEAIENLLDNAIKYTPEHGRILISVDAGEMYTEIKVEDTGKGIEAAHIHDIFKRFYRETSVIHTEGLGLGLYLARKIIGLQGGHLSVRSAQGKGSCFSVCLPNRIPA